MALTASTKWVMDYAAESCRLRRIFGTGENQTIIEFVQYEPGPGFDFTLIGKPLGKPANVSVRFGTTGQFVKSNAMIGSAGGLPAVFLYGRLDNVDRRALNYEGMGKATPAELARFNRVEPSVEAAVASMSVRVGGRTLVFALGSMGPPMAAMRKCTENLVREWGLDPAAQEALVLKPRPRNNPGEWISSSDYPRDGLRRGEQAIVRFRLMVDAAGQITSCSVQSAIAKGNFAELSCDLLKLRARLEPGRAADGTAVPSYYTGGVRWVLPR